MQQQHEIRYTSITHTNGPKGRIPRAIMWYWLGKDLVPERHGELHAPPPYREETVCSEHTRVQECVRRACKPDSWLLLAQHNATEYR